MTVLTPIRLEEITGGRWVGPAPEALALTGLGTDTREDLTGRMFLALRGETHDGHDYLEQAIEAGAAALMVEREPVVEHPVPVLLVDRVRRALGRIAHAHRKELVRTKVIAVTGSVGKSTTKNLIQAALSTTLEGTCADRSFNNDIGLPLSLLRASPEDDYAVVEIGTNAPGEIAMLSAIALPDIAVITGIGRAHLAGLGDLEGVAREKAAILDHLRPAGLAVVNTPADAAPALRDRLAKVSNVIRYGEADDADVRLHACARDADGTRLCLADGAEFRIPLPGRHNALNTLPAIIIARQLGCSDAAIAAGLAHAAAPPMRLMITEAHGIRVFNDAYNANPESMAAALTTFAEMTVGEAKRRIVILGDMLELGVHATDLHRELAATIRSADAIARLDRIVLVGSLVRHTADALGDDRVTLIDQLDESAIARAAGAIRPGDAVLLKGSRRLGLERLAEAITLAAGRPRRTVTADT